MLLRLRQLLKRLFNPYYPTQKWIEELTRDLLDPPLTSEIAKLPSKSRYIEETLDWSEIRQLHLIESNCVEDAIALSAEFYDWAKAPLGFDHDVLVTSGEVK